MESKRVLLTPEGWDANDDKMNPDASDYDDTDSECNSSSQSILLARYPSLAELSSIATNCETTKMVSDESFVQEKTFLPAASTEDCRHQITSQLNSVWNQGLPATPPKVVDSSKNSTNQTGDDPLTPTANLKMLVSAASPAIRDREIKKRELFPGQNSNTFDALHMAASSLISNSKQSVALADEKCIKEETSQLVYGENKITVSRKDKSLGLLCQKFLSKYPEYPKRNAFIEISLDDVAKDLSVERRRIYDIVNVLESVEVITRYAKNRYVWHGKSRLPTTLVKLKNYAVSQGLKLKSSPSGKENPKPKETKKEKAKKAPVVPVSSKLPLILPKDTNVMSLVQSLTPSVGLDQSLMPPPPTQDNPANDITNKKPKYKDNISEYCRKDKSLGVLSQKFLMMFLVSENRYVTLEDAANVLIGDEEEGQTKYKTKVRRLYDIANILSSLQLIEKVHIHSIQTGRKPGFRWIGIDPDKLELVAYTQDEIQNPPAVKRNCAEKDRGLNEEESVVGRFIRRRPSQQQLRSRSEDSNASKCKLPRSRSERVLGTKKLCGREEDGFSVHELTASFGADPSAASPTEAKFRAELKKLHQQYPDRMSQLLSACRHSDDFDARKSRRSLFMSGKAEVEDAPEPKRRRSADDVSTILPNTDTGFSHSSTSPFKNIEDEQKEITSCSPKQSSLDASLDHSSPEQKILLERQKQQKLLEEQRGFDSQDERWKRIKRELDKAFTKPGPSRPMMVHQSSSPLPYDTLVEQSSVAIQASLIDDVSPLKPLSYYRKLKSPWKDTGSSQSSRQASATPSPVQFQNSSALNSMSNPHALTPTPILPATERPVQVNNACPGNTFFLQIPTQPSNGARVLWATTTPPSGNSTPSPDQLIKVVGQTVNTPLMYSPRSLTPTPEPANVDLSQVSSVAETQAVFTTPIVTMGDLQQPLTGNQQVNVGNAIPLHQALTIQVPRHVSTAEMFSSSPVPSSMTHLQLNTPIMKLTDMNNVVSMETPTTTVQLLADVSKRLSLPLNSDLPS